MEWSPGPPENGRWVESNLDGGDQGESSRQGCRSYKFLVVVVASQMCRQGAIAKTPRAQGALQGDKPQNDSL